MKYPMFNHFDLQNGQFHVVHLNTMTMTVLLPIGSQGLTVVTNLSDLTDHQWAADHQLATAGSSTKSKTH